MATKREAALVKHQIEIENWKGAPLRMGVIADPHVGLPDMPVRRLRQACAQLNAQNPDIIVLLGDYRANYLGHISRIPLEDIASAFTELQAPLGVYAILGNHDWHDDKASQKRGHGPCITRTVFEAHGLRVLENECVTIDNRFNLIGLGEQWAFKVKGGFRGIDDLEKALEHADPALPNILLAHEPDIFPDLPDNIALTLSGHTHGGQVRFFSRSYYVPSKHGTRYDYGQFREGARQLVVSGGLGCTALPLRINMPAEINIIEIASP